MDMLKGQKFGLELAVIYSVPRWREKGNLHSRGAISKVRVDVLLWFLWIWK